MSEKPTVAAKVTGVQESKETALEEHCKKKQTPNTPSKKVKSPEKMAETHEVENSRSLKTTTIISISKKPENPELTEVCQMSKTTSEKAISNKPDDSDETKEICKVLKDTCKISTSAKLETSKISEVSQMPKTTSEKAYSKPNDSDEAKKVCEMLKDTSKISTSTKLEASKIPEADQMSKTTSEKSAFNKPDDSDEAKKVCQMLKDTSKISTKLEASKIPEVNQISKTTSEKSTSIKSDDSDKAVEVCQILEDTLKISTSTKSETSKILEVVQEKVPTDDKFLLYNLDKTVRMSREILDKIHMKQNPEFYIWELSDDENDENTLEAVQMHKTTSEGSVSNKFDEAKEVCQVLEDMSKISTSTKLETCKIPEVYPKTTSEKSTLTQLDTSKVSEDETESAEKDVNSEIHMKIEDDSSKDAISIDDTSKAKMLVGQIMPKKSTRETNILFRQSWPPISRPHLDERPLILASYHMVPSLPIQLFDVLAEIIEVVTKKPVLVVHERRDNRLLSEFVDIAVLPARDDWQYGELLPASFVFEHHLNKNKLPHVYSDIILTHDHPPNLRPNKDIARLRGYICAISNKRGRFTASGALFDYLYSKGENMLFFGNLLDGITDLDVLEMIASGQAQIGALESPVIRCNKHNVAGADSLCLFTSLGPLPPYRIMIKVSRDKEIKNSLTKYLLDNASKSEEWLDRLSPYGVIGFAENSEDYYKPSSKPQFTVIPYY